MKRLNIKLRLSGLSVAILVLGVSFITAASAVVLNDENKKTVKQYEPTNLNNKGPLLDKRYDSQDPYTSIIQDPSTYITEEGSIKKERNKEKESPKYAPDEIIIKFKPKEKLESKISSLSSKIDASAIKTIKPEISLIIKETAHKNKDLKIKGIELKAMKELPDKVKELAKDDTSLEPVFKGLHNKMRRQHKTEDQLDKETFDRISKARKMPFKEPQNHNLSNVYILKHIDTKNKSIEELCQELTQDPNIEYAEPNYIMKLQAFPETLPNDRYVDPHQDGTWSQGAWGQDYEDMWGIRRIQADKAWSITRGEGVVVAVIDTGVDYNHADLSQNIWLNEDEIPNNNIDDDGNGYVDDIGGWDFSGDTFVYPYDPAVSPPDSDPLDSNGHGTHVAGTIAGLGNNTIGVIGVASKAKIMPLKAFPNAYIDILAEAVRYAAYNRADVLSNSWGGIGDSQLLTDAFHYAHDLGCVAIAAAGNDDIDVLLFTPANIDTVIAVSAIDHNDQRSIWTYRPNAFGFIGASAYGNLICVAAPGGGDTVWAEEEELNKVFDILSTMPDDCEIATRYPYLKITDGYYRLGGTSMACPHVSGVAALILSRFPGIGNDTVKTLISQTADDIQSPGFDVFSGNGRVNAFNALKDIQVIFDKMGYASIDRANITVIDLERNLNPQMRDTVQINVKSDTEAEPITITLLEEDNNTGIFTGFIDINDEALNQDNILQVKLRDTIYVEYLSSTSSRLIDIARINVSTITVLKDGARVERAIVGVRDAANENWLIGQAAYTDSQGKVRFPIREDTQVRFRLYYNGDRSEETEVITTPCNLILTVPQPTIVTILREDGTPWEEYGAQVVAFDINGKVLGTFEGPSLMTSHSINSSGVASFYIKEGIQARFRVYTNYMNNLYISAETEYFTTPAPVNITLRPSVVTVLRDGAGVAGLSVAAFDDDDPHTGNAWYMNTDSSGVAKLYIKGDIQVRFKVKDHNRLLAETDYLTTPAKPVIIVRLSENTVKVVGNNDRPLVNLSVEEHLSSTNELIELRNTDANGIARFSLGEGISVYYSVSLGKTFKSDIVTTPATMTPIRCTASENRLKVTDTNDNPLAGVYITVFFGNAVLACSTDTSGIARFDMADDISVSFRSYYLGKYIDSDAVTTPSTTTIIRYALSENAVKVVDANNNSLANLSVAAYLSAPAGDGTWLGSKSTDANGMVKFKLADGVSAYFKTFYQGQYFRSDVVTTPTTAPTIFTIPDITPPVIAIASPRDGGLYGSRLTILGNVADNISIPSSVSLAISDGDSILDTIEIPVSSNGWFSKSLSFPTNGEYTLTVTAKDRANNIDTKSVHITIDITQIDTMPPVITITSPEDGRAYSQRFTITGTIIDDVSPIISADITITDSGGNAIYTSQIPVVSGAFSHQPPSLSEGEYTIRVSAADEAGNVGSTSVNVAFDVTRPVVRITSPKNNGKSGPQLAIEGTATDNLSAIDYVYIIIYDNKSKQKIYAANTPVTSGSFNLQPPTLSEGEYKIEANTFDKARNLGFATPVYFIVDATPPVVTISQPRDGRTYSSNLAIQGGVSDNRSQPISADITIIDSAGNAIYQTQAPLTSGSFNFQPPGLSNGAYRITAIAVDEAGNIGYGNEDFSIDGTPPAVTVVSPKAGTYGSNFNFLVSGSAADNKKEITSIDIYAVKEGESVESGSYYTTTPVINGQFSEVLPYYYLAFGQYDIYVEAVDDALNYTREIVRITIDPNYVNHPPELAFIPDLMTFEGETFTYPISATDADGDRDFLTFYAWNLPDGITLTDNEDGTGLINVNLAESYSIGRSGPYIISIAVLDGYEECDDQDWQIYIVNVVARGTIYEKAEGDVTQPGTGATVRLMSLDGAQTFIEYTIQDHEDSDEGKFLLASNDIPDGEYLIEVSKPGYKSYSEAVNINNNICLNFQATLLAARELISIEAEDMDNLNHEIIYGPSQGAWASAYIDTPSYPAPQVLCQSSHTLYIPEDGEYAIWLRMSQENDYNDAIELTVDDWISSIIVGDDVANDSNGFKWVNIRDGNPEEKIIVPLTKGKLTLSIRDVEPGTKIDSIIITNDPGYVPADTPPTITAAGWTRVIGDGFGDIKNYEAKMMDHNSSLYIATSNSKLHPAIYKSDDGVNFRKTFELRVPYSHGYYMHRALDLEILDLDSVGNLYALTDDWYGNCYVTKLDDETNSFITNRMANGMWTNNIISFVSYAYSGFYSIVKRTIDPMVNSNWEISYSMFGKDPVTGIYYTNQRIQTSCVFKGYLYMGSSSYSGFGYPSLGAEVWRTQDGIMWRQVVKGGFGNPNITTISRMTVFGGYLYAALTQPFGPNYIYRTRDGINWELAYQGMSGEPYIGDMISYMGRLYLTTYNKGRVYSSADGRTWTAVSNKYINNDASNSLIGDLHMYKGSLYVTTRNMTTGAQIWKVKVK